MSLRVRWCVAIACVASLVPAGPVLAAPPPGALSDAEKRELALDMMAAFVPRAEQFWAPTHRPDPAVPLPVTADVGHFNATGPGVDYYRGNGNIAQVYATLLTARPSQATFGGVPRATMFDHLRQTIRYLALSNKHWNAAHGYTWGSWPLANPWQESLQTYNWTFAAWLVRAQLDSATLGAAAEVAAYEADRIAAKPPANATPGNTGAEDNAWNTPLPIVATLLNPSSPRVSAWRQSAIRTALNASSAPGDDTAATPVIDGQPLGSWVSTTNLTSDLLMFNHGTANPSYQAYAPLAVTEAAAFAHMGGLAIPAAFDFRTTAIWDQILARFVDGNGDLIAPAGQDWTAKDFQHLAYLAAMSTRHQRVDASVLESRALAHLRDRQVSRGDGSFLGQPQIGYESMLAARLSTLFYDHVRFGPSPLPEAAAYATARAASAGVRVFPTARLVTGRLGRAFVSASWDAASPMALVVPNGDDPAAAQRPLLSAYPAGSLVGAPAQTAQPAYSCECTGDHIASAAVLGDRDFAISGFPDGIVILHQRRAAPTFALSAESIPGFAPAPTVHAASGTSGNLGGNWVALDDMLTMIVRGSSGLSATAVGGANPQLRVLGERATTTTGHRVALLLPFLPHAAAPGLALAIDTLTMPAGWSGAIARPGDGSVRLSFARWAGATTAAVTISDPRGAPVMRNLGTVSGTSLTSSLTATGVYAHNEIANFFVTSPAAIRAKTEVGDRLRLVNPTAAAASVAITWVTAGVQRSKTVSVAAGAELLLQRSGSDLVPV